MDIRINYLSELFMDYFTEFINQNAMSDNTRKEYLYRIRHICDWCEKDFLDITAQDAEKYFNYLQNQRASQDISRRTIYGRYNTCCNVSSFIQNQGANEYRNPFTSLKICAPDNECVPLHSIPSSEAMDTILEKAPDEMYYLVFALAFRVALSLSEILSLTTNHIVESGDVMFIRCNARKTIPARTVALSEDIANLMRNYLNNMPYMDEQGHLFYNKYKNPLTMDNATRCLRKIMKECNFDEKYTLRGFRSRSILDMVVATAKKEACMEDVADYVGIRSHRLAAYVKSSSGVIINTPANLVNINIKPYSKDTNNQETEELFL